MNCCVNDVSEKFGDAKNGAIVAETATAMAEATTLNHVSNAVLEAVFAQKSPKVQQEALTWLAGAVKEFGIGWVFYFNSQSNWTDGYFLELFRGVDPKALIEYCKTGLGSTNPGVRQAAIGMLGTMYLYMGSSLYMFFENEKAALRDQISAEFEKYEGEVAPTPTRGKKGKFFMVAQC